ncbi:hypothetical protein AAHA92_27731 [Salvia divinorum]|uniref:Protein FAR1-RELATED SEQUENCE n=1 Tax=Salvia divinorum TaxID=28513 RepID=A0ABD1G7S1_SALDI
MIASADAKDTDMNRDELGNIMTVRTKPAALVVAKSNGHREDVGQSKMEPHVGLEFDTAEEAQEFYSSYATEVGFKIRVGQLYRSRVDGAVISRRFVCSKEGFQTNSRTGCPAFIRVQKVDSGKWVLANIKKEHNHEFEASGELCPPRIQRKTIPTPRSSSAGGASRTGIRSHEDDSPTGVVDMKRLKKEEVDGMVGPVAEPQKGLEFNTANEAYKFYYTYAASAGFRIRIGQLFRSKHDGSITSRRFVCSKEGHQHPSRVGCGAYMRIQRQESGRWVVDRLQKEHNHEFETPTDLSRTVTVASKGDYREEGSNVLENLDLVETNGGLSLVKRVSESNISSAWYTLLLEYFQSRQAEDTGFFYAVETREEEAWLRAMSGHRPISMIADQDHTFQHSIAQTPPNEFIVRYEKALEQRREEERKEDFNTFNLQAVLHTKDPIEEQCRRLYTITMFKVFQKELLECYSYVGMKINVEGTISRYMVQKCGNSDERKTVAFNASNLNINCSCKMFEFEGVLCRHALKVLQIMNIRELPSRYVLHRWSKNAKYGILRDADSAGGPQDFKALMLWSLREEARNYIEAGAASLERYKLAFEIMQEGRRNLCWQN